MKITTVVPAYKPKYLVELLSSLLHQSVRPHRVILSDDSPDQAFVSMLGSQPLAGLVQGLNVEVVEGPRRGAFANWRHALATYGGDTELFHMLCDDDVVYPGFYEAHLNAHAQGHFAATISRRWTARENGQPLRDLPVPPAVAGHTQRLLALDAGVLFATTCARGTNWLGEVSNTVFRAERARHIMDPQVDGIAYLGMEDIGSFLCCTLTQPVCLINDHLGFFRTSAEQASSQHFGRPLKLAHLAYIALSVIGRNAGHLDETQLRHCVLSVGSSVLQHYAMQDDMQAVNAVLRDWIGGSTSAEPRFLQAWHDYAGYPFAAEVAAPLPPAAATATHALSA